MELTIIEKNGVSILELKGSLDTNSAPDIFTKVTELIDSGHQKLLFDLTETDFVSSAGLRVFLAAAKKLMAKGGLVNLCGPNDVVKDILEISGFNTIIEVKSSVNEALGEIN